MGEQFSLARHATQRNATQLSAIPRNVISKVIMSVQECEPEERDSEIKRAEKGAPLLHKSHFAMAGTENGRKKRNRKRDAPKNAKMPTPFPRDE